MISPPPEPVYFALAFLRFRRRFGPHLARAARRAFALRWAGVSAAADALPPADANTLAACSSVT